MAHLENAGRAGFDTQLQFLRHDVQSLTEETTSYPAISHYKWVSCAIRSAQSSRV
jgi:hypothetical protein